MRKRVNNPSAHLKGIVPEGMNYYVGFGIKDLTELGKNHPDIISLITGAKNRVVPSGKSGPLKENIKGKFVRKFPEAKKSVWRHIEYYNTTWEKWIIYDREFNIWEKELLHQYNLELSVARTPQGETVLYFPIFQMVDNDTHFLRAGAAMNMAYALSNYYLLYDERFNPIIPVTKSKDKHLLPAGSWDKPLQEKLAVIEESINSDRNVESTGNSYRFAVLKEWSPSEVTIGIGGFDEYLMFEYKDRNLLIFENLRSGNATYIFKLSKFNAEQHLDKQNAGKNPAFLKRVIHENMESWSTQLGGLFN